jgi:hypothetical protein
MKNRVNGFDVLIDQMAISVKRQTVVFLAVEDLPFFVRRYLVEKYRETGRKPGVWTMGEPATGDVEQRIEAWLKARYPHAIEISIQPNRKSAEEMEEMFVGYAEGLNDGR